MHWSHWWHLENSAYFDLRARIQGPTAAPGRTGVLIGQRAPSRDVIDRDVVPVLLQTLREDTSPRVVGGALLSLARIGTENAELREASLELLTGKLSASNQVVSETAALALGVIADPRAAETLLHLVADNDQGHTLCGRSSVPMRTRAFAAFGLGLTAEKLEQPALRQRIALGLIETLERRHAAHADLPVAFLTALGLCPLPERPQLPAAELRANPLIGHVLSRSSQLAYLASWIAPARGNSMLRPDSARSYAVVAAGRLAAGTRSTTRAPVIAALTKVTSNRSESQVLRAAAALALGEVADASDQGADRDALRSLVALIRKGLPLERRFAIIAAARAAARPGAGETPFAGTKAVRRVLLSELARGRSFDRGWLALGLGVLEDGLAQLGEKPTPSVITALLEVSRSKRGADDSAAVGLGMALAARGNDSTRARVGEALRRRLDDVRDPAARGHLMIAVGLVGEAGAQKMMREELERAKAQPRLLWNNAVALGLMGDREVQSRLLKLLEEGRSAATLTSVSAALGKVGTAAAIAPLLAIVGNERHPALTRAAAIDALGIVGDTEPLSWRLPIAHALPYFTQASTLTGGGYGVLEFPQ